MNKERFHPGRHFLPMVLAALQMCGSFLHAQAGASEAAVVPAQTPKTKKDFHIYLLMGQSNMAGRGRIQESASQGDNPRVLSLNWDNQWVVAKDPLHHKVGRIEPGVGPGMSFALEMLTADPNITIGLVPCAVGGSPLKRWVKGGDLYEKAIERARLASGAGIIKGVLWHQGETDAAKQQTAESYESRLGKMLDDLRADLGEPTLPVVVGQLGEFLTLAPEKSPYAETVRAAIKRVSETVPNVALADSTGLADGGDKLHFDAKAQNELGKRYAAAMQKLSP